MHRPHAYYPARTPKRDSLFGGTPRSGVFTAGTGPQVPVFVRPGDGDYRRRRRHRGGRDDGVQRRRLTCRSVIVWIERSGPHQSKLVIRSPIVVPNAISVSAGELDVPVIGKSVV